MFGNGGGNTSTPRQEKRQRILRAAIDVFAKKGYFTARMTDVAAEAGVADGTLYLYFEGKEDLLLNIFDHVLGHFVEQVEREIADVDDPVEKLRILIRMHLESLNSDPHLAQVLQIEIRHSRHFLSLFTRGKLGTYLSVLRGIIEEGQKVGRFRTDINPGLVTNVVFGAVDEFVMSWLLQDGSADLVRYVDPLMKLLIEGLEPR